VTAEATDQTPGDAGPREVLGVSAADPAARARVAALYEAHAAELKRFVLGVVRDPETAGDVLQSTFSKALEAGHAARPETIKGWLFRVAYHEALVLKRRERAGDKARRRLSTLGLAGRSSDVDPGPSAVDGLIRGELAAAVRSALDALPDPQRRVVIARMYDDQTFAEIARASGLPLGTVLTRMRLGLARLRAALGDATPGREDDQ